MTNVVHLYDKYVGIILEQNERKLLYSHRGQYVDILLKIAQQFFTQ